MHRWQERKPVERGVPQGSVLRPILWITVYDSVLRCPMGPQGRAWYVTPTTPWSWPGDAAGTRLWTSSKQPWHARCVPSRGSAWACRRPSPRPCGSVTAVKEPLLLDCPWTSTGKKSRWDARWITWVSSSTADGPSSRISRFWFQGWQPQPTPYAVCCQTSGEQESEYAGSTREWSRPESSTELSYGPKTWWRVAATYSCWGGCKEWSPSA